MAWKLTDVGKRCEPIPGIPWGDMDDAEFAGAEKAIDARFPDQKGALRRSPYFEHIDDKPAKAEPAATEKE